MGEYWRPLRRIVDNYDDLVTDQSFPVICKPASAGDDHQRAPRLRLELRGSPPSACLEYVFKIGIRLKYIFRSPISRTADASIHADTGAESSSPVGPTNDVASLAGRVHDNYRLTRSAAYRAWSVRLTTAARGDRVVRPGLPTPGCITPNSGSRIGRTSRGDAFWRGRSGVATASESAKRRPSMGSRTSTPTTPAFRSDRRGSCWNTPRSPAVPTSERRRFSSSGTRSAPAPT